MSQTPLRIIIVGAGIGGLTAAVGLRRQGHTVICYEKSSFNNEVGAALQLGPNVVPVVQELGFFPEEHGARPENHRLTIDIDGNTVAEVHAEFWAKFRAPPEMIHRVDLHKGLKELAQKHGVEFHLGNPVATVDVENAKIILRDGQAVSGDVVIGADGIHSVVRPFVTGDISEPHLYGTTAIRSLISLEKVKQDPVTANFIEAGKSVFCGDYKNGIILFYLCRNESLVNIVAMFPNDLLREPKDSQDAYEILQEAAVGHSTEEVRAVLRLAEDVKFWKLSDFPSLKTWANGRTALLGDAAHPILPYSGQGAGQAIEDAITLSELLPLGTTPSAVPARLRRYVATRQERADFVQAFGRSVGPNHNLLMPYEEYMQRVFELDVLGRAREAAAAAAREEAVAA